MSRFIPSLQAKDEPVAVCNFRKYLRIKSVQPCVDYTECVDFLSKLAHDVGLPVNVIYLKNKDPGAKPNPVVIMTLKGTDSSLPSILLNSHMDVVAVDRDMWTYDPFEAVKDANGDIYARGAQDTKALGMQYVEAARKIVKEGLTLKRTFHISFVPDEEDGGFEGMGKLLKTEEFKKLNVGFALDEGGASPDECFTLDYAQRGLWWMDIICEGATGHGSQLPVDIAPRKLEYILHKFLEYRDCQLALLSADPPCELGEITTINLTVLKGGAEDNVIAGKLTATFDVRIGINEDYDKLESTFRNWCEEAGTGVTLSFIRQDPKPIPTKLCGNPYFEAIKTAADKMGIEIKPQICPASTDSRFLTIAGIGCFGFAPMNHTKYLAHDHNEYLNETIFLKGIDIVYNIIKGLATVP